MPEVHAKLSASGSKRWMTCTASPEEESKYKEETTSYAEEGTLAHSLAELTLRYEVENFKGKEYQRQLKKIMNNELYDTEMALHVKTYVDVCMEALSEARATTEDAIIEIESRLDFSEWVPGGFGTGDCVIISDDTMEIIDLKYGKGVKVEATRNSQMMLYGLGALSAYSFMYDIKKVRMTIVQPRLDHIDSYEVDANELIWWGNQVVKPLAEKASTGKGEYHPTEEGCRFCKAKAKCRARANQMLEMAKYEFRDSKDLTNDEIADILHLSGQLKQWAKDVEDYALVAALNGEVFEGWKVVEGKSTRKIDNEEAVIEILKENEYKDLYEEPKLKTLGKLEKLVGKKKFGELVGDYIIKPPGKPTLVVESDKREVYNPAKADFAG